MLYVRSHGTLKRMWKGLFFNSSSKFVVMRPYLCLLHFNFKNKNTPGCIVLYYIVLYCIVLYCIVMCYIVMQCIELKCIILYCITLHTLRWCLLLFYFVSSCMIQEKITVLFWDCWFLIDFFWKFFTY